MGSQLRDRLGQRRRSACRAWLVPAAGVVLAVALTSCGTHASADHPPAITSPTSAATTTPTTEGTTEPVTSATTAAPTTTVKRAPTTSAAPTTATPAPPTSYSLTDPASPWVIVNTLRPLSPKTYAPTDLTSIGNGQQIRKAAATKYLAMQTAAKQNGTPIYPASSYRSYSYQVGVYNNAVARLGKAEADIVSARPGYSEHQTGWTLDVAGGNTSCIIEDCWATTAQSVWVAANAYRWGFIVRYPQGGQQITGYKYEPWHLRYVGVELATRMHTAGVTTLEREFGLPAAPAYPGDAKIEGTEQPNG